MAAIPKRDFFRSIGHKPHPKQWLFHNSKARFRLPVCGRRFGKSVMVARDIEPELFQPKKRFWCVGPTYDLGEKEFRVIWDDLIIGKKLAQDKRVRKAYNKKQGEMYIEFPWQTRIEVRSADHPENLVGEALDGVIMSEAAKHREETWNRYIRPALADRHGWGSFATTPEGMNWIHALWQIGQNDQFADYESWQFPSWENPYVYPGGVDDPEIQLLRLTMSKEEFDQEIAALFTSFVGRIYSEFEEVTHVQRVQYDPNLPNYIAIDWGYVNPMAAIEFQVTGRDQVRIWREHVAPYKILRQFLREMDERDQPPGYKIDLVFGDAADPAAAEETSMYFSPCLAMPEAKENWREGVDLVKQFLQMRQVGYDEWERPIEEPGLVVDYNCPNVIRQFNNYKAPQGVHTIRNKKSPREAAQQFDDDCLDAIRYGLMHIFKLGATYHLSDLGGSRLSAVDNRTFFTMETSF